MRGETEGTHAWEGMRIHKWKKSTRGRGRGMLLGHTSQKLLASALMLWGTDCAIAPLGRCAWICFRRGGMSGVLRRGGWMACSNERMWVECREIDTIPDTASITGPVHGNSTPSEIAVMAARTRRCIAVMIKNHTGAVAYTRQLRTAYLRDNPPI